MTLFCRSLPVFCPLSLEYLNGVKTTIREYCLVFLFGVRLVFNLCLFFIFTTFVFCLIRGLSMEALLAQIHTLDNHSALYILHSLTPLAQFEERKILDLLQQLPNSPGPGQHLLHRLSCCLSIRV